MDEFCLTQQKNNSIFYSIIRIFGGDEEVPENFGLIMLCSLIAIGAGVTVAVYNKKK